MARSTRTPPLPWSGVSRLPGLEGRIPPSRRGAIVLTTLGSLGDLYPVLSIARALEETGVETRLALSPDDCEVARSWGLLSTPLGPSHAEAEIITGMSRDAIAAHVLRDMGPLLRDHMIPMLPDLMAPMLELCHGAALVAGTAFALAGPLAAERAGLPYVPLALQPMLTFSPLDPPRARGFGAAISRPRIAPARAWNRGQIALAHAVLRARHRSGLNRVRAGIGLPQGQATPLIAQDCDVPLRLGLWDAAFSPLPADRRDGWRLTGFPPAPEGHLPREVQTWLDAGPPPLVVTLGSIAQGIAGPRFWTEAVALARALGLRAVLLHGRAEVPQGADLLALPHAAHAPLFPQAAAVLHHGGIGTTAEALRAARPQLVVPIGGDQPDNAARVARLGYGVVLPARRFRADRAMPLVRGLLERFDYAGAVAFGHDIAAADGAREAARLLAGLARTDRP